MLGKKRKLDDGKLKNNNPYHSMWVRKISFVS
jgi:hypothetical protein